MTLPTGTISMSQVNTELCISPSSTTISLNQANVRALAGVPSGTISMDNLRGKTGPLSATGGTVIDSGGYRMHIFTSPGSFVVSCVGPGTVEYLVVAGGGSPQGFPGPGSNPYLGGGGAGGFRTGTGLPITATTYPITVGGGGSNSNGSPSIFHTITSTGGGRGLLINLGPVPPDRPGGTPGGSGGGGFSSFPPARGFAGTGNDPPVSPPQGNPGGIGPGLLAFSGGGGGAGTKGSPYPTASGPWPQSAGGIGAPITWIPASYGTPGPAPGRYFAGGGGGTVTRPSTTTPFTGGPGGAGGGGNGIRWPQSLNIAGTSGVVNTGGGGGAAQYNPFPAPTQGGGLGGSGIVAIRYPI